MLFAPTFNGGSLETYYREFLEKIPQKYFLLIKRHDRELFFQSTGHKNVFEYRGTDNPMKFVAMADYLITDESSIAYDALFADIPLIFVRPKVPLMTDIAYEYDLRNVGVHYSLEEPIDILQIIELSNNPTFKVLRKNYLDYNYFFTDGKARERNINIAKQLLALYRARQSDKIDIRNEMLIDTWKLYLKSQGKTIQHREKDIIKYDTIFKEV